MLAIFAILLPIAALAGGANQSAASVLPNLVAAIVPACLIDGVWLAVTSRRLRFPTSALLTALFVASILSVDETWLVVAWTSALAVLSKHILTNGREHVFNPAALALVLAPVAFGSGESWWGALGDAPWVWLIVLVAPACSWLTD